MREAVSVEVELCAMVGVPDLPTYLGHPVTASTETLTAALQARRRLLQGMLANPKLQREASFVVKNIFALDAVLKDVPAHVEAMARRAEERHLPALELMVEGVLASGPLGPDREAQLLRGVLQLGVREQTFRELLARVIGRPGAPRSPPALREPPASIPGEVTLYEVLQLSPRATAEEILTAVATGVDAATGTGRAIEAKRERVRIAGRVLLHEGARRLYDQRLGIAEAAETGDPDLYRLLGLRPTATGSEIQGAYELRLASTPQGPEGAVDRQRLEVAKLVLRHEGARRRYDRREPDTVAPVVPAAPKRVLVTRRLVASEPTPAPAPAPALARPGVPAVSTERRTGLALGAALAAVAALGVPAAAAAALAAVWWLATR